MRISVENMMHSESCLVHCFQRVPFEISNVKRAASIFVHEISVVYHITCVHEMSIASMTIDMSMIQLYTIIVHSLSAI
jgi:hypothetical protein